MTFCDGQIPENGELTFGVFSYEGNFLGDVKVFPLRYEMPFSEKVSIFAQVDWLKMETIFGNTSTFGVGCGGMYNLVEDGEILPFAVALRGSINYYFDKEEDFVSIDSWTEFGISGIASKKFNNVSNFDITPYAGVTLAFTTEDESDTALTIPIGARAKFNGNWSMFAELDFGDRDGWGIGGAYSF